MGWASGWVSSPTEPCFHCSLVSCFHWNLVFWPVTSVRLVRLAPFVPWPSCPHGSFQRLWVGWHVALLSCEPSVPSANYSWRPHQFHFAAVSLSQAKPRGNGSPGPPGLPPGFCRGPLSLTLLCSSEGVESSHGASTAAAPAESCLGGGGGAIFCAAAGGVQEEPSGPCWPSVLCRSFLELPGLYLPTG